MIYITENGVSEKMPCTELCDDWRIQYMKDYINEMLKGQWYIKYDILQRSETIFVSQSCGTP